jgi:hypothetical protein
MQSMDHKVGFLNIAGQGILAVMIYSMLDTKIAESFRVKEASSIEISFTPPERTDEPKCEMSRRSGAQRIPSPIPQSALFGEDKIFEVFQVFRHQPRTAPLSS